MRCFASARRRALLPARLPVIVLLLHLFSSNACSPIPLVAVDLIKSVPSETDFDHTDIRSAAELWPKMIDSATRTIDLAQFYVINDEAPSSLLTPVLQALEAAVRRKVVVRLLADAAFAEMYPQELARLAEKGVQVRRLDLRPLTRGVLHAKYFVIDDREAFLGSQNFDWRSLEHIHEMGMHLRSTALARSLTALFESDWALAAGQRLPISALPVTSITTSEAGERVDLVYSPRELSPARAFELPVIIDLIKRAERSIRIELLIYRGPQEGETDTPMAQIEAALIAAGARGVRVEVLLSDWMLGKKHEPGLRGLRGRPGIAVKIVTIPRSTKGDIPFARLIHAKYLLVDGARFWLGSSNWEDRYFDYSRNVGVRVESARLAQKLEQMFSALWQRPYAAPLQP